MKCCQCEGIEREFDENEAAAEIKAYRKDGPAETTQILIDALTELGVEGMSLLDIGGGVGAIQHAMLSAGGSSATTVEASTAFARAARSEAQNLGWTDEVEVHHGDFTDLAETIVEHDIVTLDRVLCCYHDMEALTRLSAERASKLYGLVFPRDVFYNRIASRIGNLFLWITRNPFRFFIHSDEGVQRILDREGLEKAFHKKLLSWQVVVYTRAE